MDNHYFLNMMDPSSIVLYIVKLIDWSQLLHEVTRVGPTLPIVPYDVLLEWGDEILWFLMGYLGVFL